MDPLTHSLLAVAVATAATKEPKHRAAAALVGLAAGLLPDADIYLKSSSDPLFTLEYHRHFTHSLFLSPLMAVIAVSIAMLLRKIFRKSISFKALWLPAWLAILSHIFCDAWTSYGTRVWWPFDQQRVSLDWISVVDPVFTVPLLIFMLIAWIRKSQRIVKLSLIWCAFYISLCVVQQYRVKSALEQWMVERNLSHPERFSVKPSFGNILVWRGMMIHDHTFRVVAVRAGFGSPQFIEGETSRMYRDGTEVLKDFQISAESRQGRDVLRFDHFSDQWLGVHPQFPNLIGDLRYATLPQSIFPLWGIELDPTKPDEHVKWRHLRGVEGRQVSDLWNLIKGDLNQ